VELGGRGRYAAAGAVLGRLLADAATPPAVAAHAAVALASHRRQQGGHAAARVLDARGLALASAASPDPAASTGDTDGTDPDGTDPDGTDPDGTGVLAARVDALVGLAADAVGLGDPDGAARLLDAAEALGHTGWRPAVRAGWVRAELALVTGRAAEAVEPADRALAAARAAGSPRHVLKSRLVRAVTEAVLRPDGAVLDELDTLGDEARDGWPPLEWPARLAAADLAALLEPRSVTGSTPSANERRLDVPDPSVNGRRDAAARRRHAARLTVSVLHLLSDGPGRRALGVSPWVPERLPLT
jgi:hypothetical protein